MGRGEIRLRWGADLRARFARRDGGAAGDAAAVCRYGGGVGRTGPGERGGRGGGWSVAMYNLFHYYLCLCINLLL